jgi:hypothetical protein
LELFARGKRQGWSVWVTKPMMVTSQTGIPMPITQHPKNATGHETRRFPLARE